MRNIISIITMFFIISNTINSNANENNNIVRVYQNGESLNENCRDYLKLRRSNNETNNVNISYRSGSCYSYIIGIVDSLSFNKTELKNIENQVCIKDDTNGHSIVESVAIYLDDHPEKRNVTGYAITIEALKEKFPCS